MNSQHLPFEVMTPKLFSAPGRPRLFLDVNVSSVLTAEVGLARDADVGELMFPDDLVPGQILGEQLATKSRLPGSQCRTNSELLLTPHDACEREIGHVRASDDEDETRRRHQD